MRKPVQSPKRNFADVIAQLKIGMTELELMTEVDYQMRRHGSLGPSFTTSLQFRPRSSMLFSSAWMQPRSAARAGLDPV